MNRVRFFALLVLMASMLACQTTDIIISYLSPPPTPTRTRTPTRPAAIAPPAQPTPPPVAVVPTPTVPAEIIGTVTENSRVRASPSTSAAILTRLNKGDQVKVVGRNAASDWYEILLPSDANARGWISAELVQLQGSPEALPVVQPGAIPPTRRPYP